MKKIVCDPNQRAWTLHERGLDSWTQRKVFAGTTFTIEDARRFNGEIRFQTAGLLEGRLVMIVCTPGNDARHVISMRKCDDREKAKFGERLAEG